jgi:adenylylsulfate kinase
MNGFTVWLTGLPCAGKTTIVTSLQRELLRRWHLDSAVLEGEEMRMSLCKGLGFSRQDRDTNVFRIGWVCQLLTQHGIPNIVAAVSPYRDARNEVRAMVEKAGGKGSFIEVWVNCPLDVCIRRDVKGLYAKAISGQITNFTGVSDPYEEPFAPEVVLRTDRETAMESVERLLVALRGPIDSYVKNVAHSVRVAVLP